MKHAHARSYRAVFMGFAVLGIGLLTVLISALVSRSPAPQSVSVIEGPQARLPGQSLGLLMDPARRVAEARRLGTVREAAAAPVLGQLSRDGDTEFRKACVWALGSIASPASALTLTVRAEDQDPGVRAEAARAMGALYAAVVKRSLGKVEAGHGSEAATAETDDGACRAVISRSLSEMTEDEVVEVRLTVAQVLSAMIEHGLPIAPLAKLRADTDRQVRAAAVRGLAGSAGDEATAALAAALRDADAEIRLVAAREIARRRGAAANAGLAWALASEDASVRAVALEALRGIGKAAVPQLRDVLTGASSLSGRAAAPSVAVRAEAARLLGHIGGVETVPVLVGLLDSADLRTDAGEVAGMRAAVIEGLVGIGPAAIPALRDEAMIGEHSALAEQTVADACERFGAAAVPAIVSSIVRWKVYPDPGELALWVKTLGRIGDPAAVPALDFALGQEHLDMRALVAEARAAIEKKSGVKLPPAAPARLLPEPAVGDFARLPSARSVADAPATALTDAVPTEGVMLLTLRGALFRGTGEQRGGGAHLYLHLERRGGEWVEPLWGIGCGFARHYNPARVLAFEPGDPLRLRIEFCAVDDSYGPGAHAEYDVRLRREPVGWSGRYEGRCNGVRAQGEAAAECRAGRILPPDAGPVAGHPRLLFRVGDLPVLRARARTEFGRAVLRALLDQIAAGKAADYSGRIQVQDWDGASQRALAMGFLAHLFEDPALGERAAKSFMATVRTKPYQGEHGDPGPISSHGFVYDMTHSFLSEPDLSEATKDLATLWGYARVAHGMSTSGGFPGEGHPYLGPNVMALVGEKGPFFGLAPQRDPYPIPVLEPDAGGGQSGDSVPNAFKDGGMMANWLAAGPFPPGPDGDPLASLGGPEKAMPRRGTTAAFRGAEYAFLPLPSNAVREASGFGGKNACIALPGARPDARTYLYGVLDVPEEQGAHLDCTYPLGYRSARVWFDGVPVADRVLLVLKPGRHRVLIELNGSHVSPYLKKANAGYALAQEKKQAWMRQYYETERARHEKEGVLPGMARLLTWMSRATRDLLRIRLEEHLGSPVIQYGGYRGFVGLFANSYGYAMGEPLSRDTPWDFDLRPELLRSLSDQDLCFALQLASESVKPFVVHEFDLRFPPQNLRRLNCRQLVTALANYPLDVKPRPFDESQARMRIDRERGICGFQSGRAKGDLSVWVYTRPSMQRHPIPYLPRAGCFRIDAFGQDLVRNVTREYDTFLGVGGAAGDGTGRVLYEDTDLGDDQAVLALDVSDAYRGGTNSAVRVERHVAVDFSGRSGAPLLVAVLDRVRGVGEKTWSFPGGTGKYDHADRCILGTRLTPEQAAEAVAQGHTTNELRTARVISSGDAPVTAEAVARAGGQVGYQWAFLKREGQPLSNGRKDTFAIVGDRGVTLLGRFATPVEPPVSFDVHHSRDAWTAMRVRTDADPAESFVVMTVQTNTPPEMTVRGEGLDAVVAVGEQEVRFDGAKLVLKR